MSVTPTTEVSSRSVSPADFMATPSKELGDKAIGCLFASMTDRRFYDVGIAASEELAKRVKWMQEPLTEEDLEEISRYSLEVIRDLMNSLIQFHGNIPEETVPRTQEQIEAMQATALDSLRKLDRLEKTMLSASRRA